MSNIPKTFFWGAATSSHQVEGDNHNDWSEWEHNNAERLSKTAKRKWEKWQQTKFPEMFDSANYISGKACDHYSRFQEDFDIAKKLGHNAHRFSIEWSRIEPKKGKFDKKEIAHYAEVIKALRDRDIEPFVTLCHFTLPVWVADKGGWVWRKTPRYFARFTAKMAEALGDRVQFWTPLNEPIIYATNSFLRGMWPPQTSNPLTYYKVINRLLEGHRRSYEAIKNVNPNAHVGMVKNVAHFESSGGIWNGFLERCANWLWNDYILNAAKKNLDFIGVNYYFHYSIKGWIKKTQNKQVSDMGWELYPDGLFHVLTRTSRRYNIPLYVTENGLADADDTKRSKFIKEHTEAVKRARKEGSDVRGYFYWSLLDNFEWDKGFWPRFGLVEVDFKTFQRRIRGSARAQTSEIE